MTRVLVTSAASSPGIDICRSLAKDPTVVVVGADANPFGRQLAARHCDTVVVVPSAIRAGASYVDAMHDLTSQVDFVFVSLDVEVEALVGAGFKSRCPHALPMPWADVLLDKSRTASLLDAADVPATIEVTEIDTLAGVLDRLGGDAWLRPSVGTSGQASSRISNEDEAANWITFWRRRGIGGRWIVQEYLPGPNINWTGLFNGGRLVAAAAMERLHYLLNAVAPSGVTGQVKLCETVCLPEYRAVAERAVRTVAEEPHGLFSVDLCGDSHGRPKVTEINPRPAGRPWLYTQAGVNLPLAALRVLTGQPVGDAMDPGGLRVGVKLYRQIDTLPLIVEPEDGSSGG